MLRAEQKEQFMKVCDRIVGAVHDEMGIGTYGEKTLHRVLKTFFCEDTDWHEVGLGSFVADAMVGDTIYEIQTGGFYPLRKKLSYYLSRGDKRVVVVVPIAAKKRMIWIDPETGAVANKPRTVSYPRAHVRVLRELFWLCDLAGIEQVTFRLVYLSIDEYKKLDGYGKDKKIKSTKIERIPRELLDMDDLKGGADIGRYFLPNGLPSPFTSADFARQMGVRRMAISTDLRVLETFGVIRRVGKKGNSILYEK